MGEKYTPVRYIYSQSREEINTKIKSERAGISRKVEISL